MPDKFSAILRKTLKQVGFLENFIHMGNLAQIHAHTHSLSRSCGFGKKYPDASRILGKCIDLMGKTS